MPEKALPNKARPDRSMDKQDKHRLRFQKSGELRWVSHLDLARSFERMLRRANIPIHFSGGFHPQPRMIFAMPLPLGAIGHDEVVELELTEELPPEQSIERLNTTAPNGLTFHRVQRVELRAKAMARRVVYQFPIISDRLATVVEKCQVFLSDSEHWVERMRPRPRKVNVRPYVRDIRIADTALELDIWVTPTGSARADELIRILGLGDRLTEGDLLERTVLEVQDEISPDEASDGPILDGPMVLPIRSDREEKPRRTDRGGIATGPVVE